MVVVAERDDYMNDERRMASHVRTNPVSRIATPTRLCETREPEHQEDGNRSPSEARGATAQVLEQAAHRGWKLPHVRHHEAGHQAQREPSAGA
jgi:hypothetical protein